MAKGRDKVDRLLQQIDELQAEDAKAQLQARRAERDLREEREKALRLERELEGWKGLRVERSARSGHGSSEWGGSVRGKSRQDWRASEGGEGLTRLLSDSKGFL